MKERQVEIVDKTLVALWSLYEEKVKEKKEKVKELIKLIYLIGSDYIEITPEIYEELFPLPVDVEFRVNVVKELYIPRGKYIDSSNKINKNINNLNNIRIAGLDDLMLYDYEEKLLKLMDSFGKGMELCIGNEFGCATALTLEWIKLGGHKVVTSFAGIGGYAPLEELLGSVEFIQKINLRGNHVLFPTVLQIYEEIIGEELPYNMPFIGKNIFNVESGVHVNGISKNVNTYEPYDPKEIGRERKIVIGKHSGIKSLKIKLEELNIAYEEEKLEEVLEVIRKKSTQIGRGLLDDEIEGIYSKVGVENE
ncbi:isopropylmalate synthase [Clostridium sp. SHJSY1]|uniref:homocitrate synthase/isopropylmalate synthase family protein n=1 Tax=Clostridium sp. SHJSY1 TaxID=2942483 RepID=UPI002874C798|nr:isopropylmalate synthase [Clostridium sp. SHJSY1]MDS0526892.1 isopropylmalate synthase [Clostridium sp. SHJSY1]